MKNRPDIKDQIKAALVFEGINLDIVDEWVNKHSIDSDDIYNAYQIKEKYLAGKHCFFACVLNDYSVDEYLEIIK